MNILLLTFGEKNIYHLETHFLIRTLLKYKDKEDHIFVATDSPQRYENLKDVSVIRLTKETLEEWKGKHHFFWRIKIKAIEYLAEQFPNEHLLYLDSDSFVYHSLKGIKSILDTGKGLMDGNDGCPKNHKFRSHRMWECVNGKTYGNITIGEQHNMWIAGVVGIPVQKLKEIVKLALTLCDGMLDDGAEPVVVEQYSLSIALWEIVGLQSSRSIIGHYWDNKDGWNKLIADFFLYSYMTHRSLEQEIKDIDQLPLKTTPLLVKKRSTRLRLQKLLYKLFPDKIVRYIEM